jgi:hypothetical protein
VPKPTEKEKNGKSIEPIDGGPEADNIFGTEGNDIIYGFGENDVIDGLAGDDTIYGGDGGDFIIGGSGDDVLFGEAGNDQFIGGVGNDTIDGGDGDDTITYMGTAGTDYTVETVTEVMGKGRNRQEVLVTYVTATDGSVDTLTDVSVNFVAPLILAFDDLASLDANTANEVTIDVLANDGYLVSYTEDLISSADLEIISISDGDSGLIPDGTDFNAFSSVFGVDLSDGSNLKLNEDGTLTFTVSATLDTDTTYNFSYDVSYYDAIDVSTTVTFNVTKDSAEPPGTPETLTLETVTEVTKDLGRYYGDGSYAITQLTQGLWGIGVTIEERDASLPSGFDYDGDGDSEWRVWTEANGTLHDMNITTIANAEASLDGNFATTPSDEFIFKSFTLTGLDENEGLTVEYYRADGTFETSDYIGGLADLSPDGLTFYSTYDGPVGQLSFSANAGTEVYVDDVEFI